MATSTGNRAEPTISPPRNPSAVSRRWRNFADVPAPVVAGTWRPYSWDNQGSPQHGIELRSARAPWRRLVAVLDELGRDLVADPVPVEDEADAIVACCWRYGSYFDLLTGGERFPPFRSDADLSRLGDEEMQRINIEFSSGLAAWIADRERDPARIRRRVRAALAHLPMPWREGWGDAFRQEMQRRARIRAEHLTALGTEASRSAELRRWLPALPEMRRCRQEANDIVNATYRNGPIENFHAGTWSLGTEVPGFMRFWPGEVRRLAGDASLNMAVHLLEREFVESDVLGILYAAAAPRNWSVTADTSDVRFLGLPGADPLDARIRLLAHRYPRRFQAVFDL